MLDQNQQRSAATDQLGFLVLCENLAGVLNRSWLDYIEASHFTPRTRSAGVLECWSDVSEIPSLHYSKHFIAPFLLLFLCCGPQDANGRRLQPFGAALLERNLFPSITAVVGHINRTLPRRARRVAAGHIAKRSKNRIFVVGVVGQLPAHRGVFSRQSRADLSPALAAVLAAINSPLNTARLIPVLRRSVPAGQEHRRSLAGEVDHIMKVIALHAFFGAPPAFFRRVGDEKSSRSSGKVSRCAAWRTHEHMYV